MRSTPGAVRLRQRDGTESAKQAEKRRLVPVLHDRAAHELLWLALLALLADRLLDGVSGEFQPLPGVEESSLSCLLGLRRNVLHVGIMPRASVLFRQCTGQPT